MLHSLLLQAMPDVLVVIDGAGSVRWANEAAERLFNRPLDSSLGISGLELLHPDDVELALRSLVTVQDKDVGTAIELRVDTVEGWRLMEVIGSPIGWFEEGAVLLCLRDVTDRRRFEVARSQEAQFRSLVQNSSSVTMLVSSDGIIESVSGALTRLLGHDPELVEKRPLGDLVEASDRPALAAALDLAREGASTSNPVTVEVPLLRYPGDETVPFELAIVNLLDDPTVSGFVISAHDITARSIAESRLRNALSLLTATLDSTADGILVVDLDGMITSFNQRFVEMWNFPESFVESTSDAAAIKHAADQLLMPADFVSKIEELYSQPEAESEDVIEFKDGRVLERRSKPQRVEGVAVGRVWSFRDVTDRKRLEKELSYQAFHDSLTGLANKALFQDRLQHAAARLERAQAHLAVLFIDIDNFKTVNDSLGHGAGDEMLRRVAEVIVSCLRRVDTAARLGGDEFAVLVEDIKDRSDAVTLAKRILTALDTPVSVANNDVSVTVSIGITFDSPGITSDQLLRNADLAMYTAKERGKNRYEEFESNMHENAVARMEVQAHLNQALDGLNGNEIVVHYQPIVDLYTESIVGFEALARWKHPTRGLLAPISFIPFAEESDLINRIDSFVMIEACNRLREWQLEYDPALSMSVNLSSRRLIDTSLADDVTAILHRTGVAASKLIVEITESAVMRDREIAAYNLATLKTFGVRIALDDFGTGYSSLSYLEHLPIDIIKIDRTFVSSIKEELPTRGLTPAIVQLAQTLGHTAIAEGVESPAQVMQLRRLGCRLAQGFHLGIPQDAQDSVQVLETQQSTEYRRTKVLSS
ncbi:MAG: EAL domain-containing protein [Acidimicrobiales bacterium]